MTRLLIVPILLATLTAAGCSDDGGNGTGVAGSGGGAAGSGGGSTGNAGSGGTGGGSAFMAVAPCNAAADYVTTPTTIDFGLLGSAFSYAPKCLKVPTGTQVTFTSTTSDFAVHPLDPSGNRGTRPGNPITPTTTGTTASFTFPAKGFWAYYCTVHGSSDDGSFMAGVIWAD